MAPTLNRIRLAALIAGISMTFAIPVFWYWRTLFPMPTFADILVNAVMAIFVGGCAAGVIVHLSIFAMGGTLPRWFWVDSPHSSASASADSAHRS